MNIIWTLFWYDPRLSPYKVESWLRFAEVMLRVGEALAWVGVGLASQKSRQPHAKASLAPRQRFANLHHDFIQTPLYLHQIQVKAR